MSYLYSTYDRGNAHVDHEKAHNYRDELVFELCSEKVREVRRE